MHKFDEYLTTSPDISLTKKMPCVLEGVVCVAQKPYNPVRAECY